MVFSSFSAELCAVLNLWMLWTVTLPIRTKMVLWTCCPRDEEGLHWKQFGLAREVRGRSWRCPLRPHGKTTGPYRSLGGDRVGNLSTSSLSSFPLFWQPSALTTLIIPQSFWAWTEHETQSQSFTTRLPRVRVQLNQGLMCVNSKGRIVTYLLARTCHIDLNPSPSMPCMFYKIGLLTPQMV